MIYRLAREGEETLSGGAASPKARLYIIIKQN